MTEKKEIRGEVRRRIKLLDKTQMTTASNSIFDQIERMEIFRSSRCVALFVSMHDEVPTDLALERWPQLEKRIVVPRVEGDVMRFYDYSSEQMTEGAFGILEPMGDHEVTADQIDLIIVPARAFTHRGERLGRGGGFYDKYMSLKEFRAAKVGIAFECQIFDELPCDDHDIRVDEVVTA